MSELDLGGRRVGDGAPVLVIAEAGVNHNGELERAHALINAAADAGADVVKFQSFVTEEIITPQAPKAAYQRLGTEAAESQFQMLKRLEMSPAQQAELMRHCERRKIIFLSTPYDHGSVDALTAMNVCAFKIASTDTTNLPFLHHVARQGKPVLLSTGMCDLQEVEAAVNTLREGGLKELALLHCTSEYPAPMDEMNLRAIQTLKDAFGCPVGFSDHTKGIHAAAWAVVAGATIIEKHFTLDRGLPGPDHAASIEPPEMAEMIRQIRQAEVSLGSGIKVATASELGNKAMMQKSLVARVEIPGGTVIQESFLTCKRPASGLAPKLWKDVVGKKSARKIAADEILTRDAVVWE